MSVITTPSDTDVVFHSGNRYANASHGTKMWSLLIAANKPLFCSLSKKDESSIAASIVSAVHNVGGTFLVKDKTSGMYYNVGTECAHDSTLFALGGTEPHYAESVEEISKVKRLFQAQCDYFTNTKQNNEEDLGNQVQSLVKMELDRLTNQAQHVEKTIIGNTSFTNATTKQQKEEEGQEGEKVAVAEDLENDNEQQQEEEVDAAVQVSALDALQQDNDQQANSDKEGTEATDEVEPSSDTDIVNKTVDTDENETVMLSAKPGEATEIHTLDDVIVEDEDKGKTTTKRQRVE